MGHTSSRQLGPKTQHWKHLVTAQNNQNITFDFHKVSTSSSIIPDPPLLTPPPQKKNNNNNNNRSLLITLEQFCIVIRAE